MKVTHRTARPSGPVSQDPLEAVRSHENLTHVYRVCADVAKQDVGRGLEAAGVVLAAIKRTTDFHQRILVTDGFTALAGILKETPAGQKTQILDAVAGLEHPRISQDRINFFSGVAQGGDQATAEHAFAKLSEAYTREGGYDNEPAINQVYYCALGSPHQSVCEGAVDLLAEHPTEDAAWSLVNVVVKAPGLKSSLSQHALAAMGSALKKMEGHRSEFVGSVFYQIGSEEKLGEAGIDFLIAHVEGEHPDKIKMAAAYGLRQTTHGDRTGFGKVFACAKRHIGADDTEMRTQMLYVMSGLMIQPRELSDDDRWTAYTHVASGLGEEGLASWRSSQHSDLARFFEERCPLDKKPVVLSAMAKVAAEDPDKWTRRYFLRDLPEGDPATAELQELLDCHVKYPPKQVGKQFRNAALWIGETLHLPILRRPTAEDAQAIIDRHHGKPQEA